MNILDKLVVGIIKGRIKAYVRKLKKMAEKERKPWYLSKGVIGGLLTVGFVAIQAGGIKVEPDIATIDLIADNIILLLTGAAGVLSLIGRLFATKEIK